MSIRNLFNILFRSYTGYKDRKGRRLYFGDKYKDYSNGNKNPMIETVTKRCVNYWWFESDKMNNPTWNIEKQ